MIYEERLTTIVERKVSSSSPKKIGLVFDAWTVSTTHYVAVFATYSAANLMGYDYILFAFSPIEDETNRGAENYIEFSQFDVNDRSLDDVTSLTGDNCAVNKCISNKCTQIIPLQFEGCALLKFNLYVKSMINSNESLIFVSEQ